MKNNLVFIVNPISGNEDKDTFVNQAKEVLSKSGLDVELYYTTHKGHAKCLAAESDENSVVVAVGGDGTVNEVASGIIGTNKVLGIIPYGSGNGLARHIGISMTPMEALKTIIAHKIKVIDSATINGIPFFSVCGVGLDAEVDFLYTQMGTRGLHTYVKASLQSWNNRTTASYSLVIDGAEFKVNASMITIGNSNQWGNSFYITPQAILDDGLLDIAIVGPLQLHDIPLQALLTLTKGLPNSDKVHYFRGKHISIIRESEGPTHYDGEPILLGRDININVVEKSLNVIIP